MNSVLEQSGPSELSVLKQPQIINELTNTIREWSDIWKQLYVSHDQNFENIEKYINKLIKYRVLLKHSENLLEDKLSKTQEIAMLYINYGNKLLCQDMVVWDEQGNILNPLHTPTFKLYKFHETTTKNLRYSNIFKMFKKSIKERRHQSDFVYLLIRHKKKQSLIHYINYVKKITNQDIISPSVMKSHIDSILKNELLEKRINVLNLLCWENSPNNLLQSFSVLENLRVNELLMSLHDILDALFNIYKYISNVPSTSVFDELIFKCLQYIIKIISDENHLHFQQVLEVYIEKYFNSEFAHIKLMAVLICNLNNLDLTNIDVVYSIIKSFKYIMKFITKSKLLSSKSMEGDQHFENSMKEIFKLVSNLMGRIINSRGNEYLLCECLKFVPLSIPDIITVFSSTQLSLLLVKLIKNLPPTMLVQQKLNTMSDIVHSQLFLNAECQDILLSFILDEIIELLMYTDERMYILMCIHLLGEMMDLIHATSDSASSFKNITKVMQTSLKIIVQIVIKIMNLDSHLMRSMVSLMISILRQMTDQHFEIFTKHIKTDLLDFLKDILIIFKYLVSNSVFPRTWNEMIMIQNCVILKSLRYFSPTIWECFLEDIDQGLWKNFFDCAFTFTMQPSLQLEKFSPQKRLRIYSMYNDMRMESITLIWDMWSHLGKHKIYFMPDMISSILEISLIPQNKLRESIIPIFFEMMQCEFDSCTNYDAITEDSSNIKGEFNIFLNGMITNLDRLVLDGKGDKEFKELFKTILLQHCESHQTMKDQGLQFIEIFTRLLEYLLDYQTSINDENNVNKIHCIVNLLNFYRDIQHLELIVSYVYKLCPLHLECKRYTEAAFTLKIHSELLSWSNDPLPFILRNSIRYPSSETNSQLKEVLLIDIIDYFNRGEMWECAIIICKELVNQCESETYDYVLLSSLLQQMSKFYDKILRENRTEPKYFKISYYGKGFPSNLQNKAFIYRGDEFETINTLIKRVEDQFPDASFMKTLSQPGPRITESPNQYIQINIVEPIIAEHNEYFSNKWLSEEILKYYRVNQVTKFKYTRKSTRSDPNIIESINSWTECTEVETAYSLPGIVKWSPVKNVHTYELSPLNNAIDDVKKKNDSLRESIRNYANDDRLKTLSIHLHSVLSSLVRGGILKYEQEFFTSEYLINHKEEEKLINNLKNLIAFQISLSEFGLKLLKNQAPLSMLNNLPFLENQHLNMKNHFEKNYGIKIYNIISFNYIRNYASDENNSKNPDSEIRSVEAQNGSGKI